MDTGTVYKGLFVAVKNGWEKKAPIHFSLFLADDADLSQKDNAAMLLSEIFASAMIYDGNELPD